MRDYKVVLPLNPGPKRAIRNDMPPAKGNGPSRKVVDPVTQKTPGLTAPGELGQFEGLSDQDVQNTVGTRYVPPDVNGDVSQDQFVVYINTIWAVYDKTGNLLLGPLPGNSFWQGLGGVCETTDDGDPVVKYDRDANRWFATQFSVSGPNSHQCFAVSQTSDATGAWNQYDFFISNDFADYPKFGIWPDAYYMTANLFGAGFNGGAYAFNRAKMIAGDPSAEMVGFNIFYNGNPEGGVLPSDWNGPQSPPPAGAPNHFMTFDLVPGPDACAGSCLLMWDFHVDFETPGNSTFTGPAVLPVPAFNSPVCGNFRDQCVPQLGSPELLETLSQDLMYPLAYRNMGDHEALVASQTVGDGSGVAQVRWYEIRDPASPVIYQAATFAPDSSNRWMPSIAMDRNGNIALNYSRSDSTIHPQASLTGRLAGDPLNTMGAEVDWFSGAGSQVNSFNRWGDYTSIFLDPLDDCTFWAMNEYYATTTDFDFKTRVGSFKFDSCTSGPTGVLEGTVTRDDGVTPIQGATVTANTSSTLTNPAGHYSFTLPVGDYDMTATKFGYTSDSANGVSVTDGGDTVQNFQLTQTQQFLVTGVVKDGGGQGWPLYAKVVITANGFPGATLYTDPVTGYYSISLVGGNYNFLVSAVVPGYLNGGGPVAIGTAVKNDPGGQIVNWALLTDSPACIAPGYGPPTGVLNEHFDSGSLPPGWSLVTNNGFDWQFVSSLPCNSSVGNLTGGTGGFAVGDGICDFLNFNVFDDNELITPSVDMTAATSPIIQWNNDFNQGPYYHQTADVDVSTDGGSNWTNVWERTSDARGPDLETVDLTAVAAGQANVKARFHYKADPNDFWAWWWQVDNVFMGQQNTPCTVVPGGIVTGFVRDTNSGLGLNGATVKNLPDDGSTKTAASNSGDGYYLLFAGSGSQPFEASAGGYVTQDKNITVVPNSTNELDFSLDSGVLDADPHTLSSKVNPGDTDTQTLTMSNSGSGEGSFKILEIDAPLTNKPKGPFVSQQVHNQIFKWLASLKGPGFSLNKKGVKGMGTPRAPIKTRRFTNGPGDVLTTFNSGLGLGWGVGFNGFVNNVWISDPSYIGGGTNDNVAFGTDGTPTGAAIDLTNTGGLWIGDETFNSRTGMLWGVNVGGDNCLAEMDPVNQVVTGNEICGPWGISQRGVAYDGGTDTYFVGGWNEGIIYHIDGSGALLDSAQLNLGNCFPSPACISGLAFDSQSHHLLVMQNEGGQDPIVVLDANNGYSVIGSIAISGFSDFGGAGMDFDCLGNLWLIDQANQTVYEIESGEPPTCGGDIPWVSEDPTEGTVPAGGNKPAGTLPVAVTFDSTGLFPGLRQAQFIFTTDTPYQVAPVGLNLTVRFLDVLDNDPPGTDTYENYIYGAAGANIMHGCAFYYFCPSAFVTRADMAGYIERSVHGAFTPPPVYTGIFSDVFFGDYNADYIQGLWDDQITGGCQFPGNPLKFCPNDLITRGQMAVFIERGKNGPDYVPPDCTGYFTDVTCPPTVINPFGNWIEQLHNDGITAGCDLPGEPGYPKYCPDGAVPNEQMAVFLVKRWGFPVLP